MTPLRSHMMPPSAAKASGVAKRNIAAISADHTNTSSRLLSPDFVATTAPTAPMMPAAIAPQPSRRSPPCTAITPAATATAPSSRDGTGVRISNGGSAMNQASAPQATPNQPSGPGATPERDAARVAALTPAPPLRQGVCHAFV